MSPKRPFESILGEATESFELEYRRAMESAVVLDRSHLARIEVTGSDRETFLQNMLSADVKTMPLLAGQHACFLTNKGKLVSDLILFRETERFVLELETDRVSPFLEALSRYIISEDVTLESLEATDVSFSIEGPDAPSLLARLTGTAASTFEGLDHLAATFLGEATVVAHRREPSPRFDVVAAAERALALARQAIACGALAGSERLADTRRIEAGRPLFGVDMDETYFPLEAGLDDAISFDKGCYIGQEYIARLAHRGHLNRKLIGIRFEGSEVPAKGALVSSALGQPAGTVTSAASSPGLGGVAALACLKSEFWSPGTDVTVEDCPGRVTALPFRR